MHYARLFPGQTAADGLLILILIYTGCVVVTSIVGGVISDRSGRRKMLVTVSGLLMAAAALLLVIRPVSVAVGLFGSNTSASQRGLIGWFGIRGIGSLYYLMYATNHGLDRELAANLGALVFATVIPRNVRLSEAPSHARSVLDYDPHSAGAQAYRALAAELMEREATREAPGGAR